MQSEEEPDDGKNIDPEQFKNALVRKFQNDFIKGCIAFLTIAATIHGDDRDGQEVFNDMIEPLVGNRNPDSTGFDTIMPELYKKVVDYCSRAVIISEAIEQDME